MNKLPTLVNKTNPVFGIFWARGSGICYFSRNISLQAPPFIPIKFSFFSGLFGNLAQFYGVTFPPSAFVSCMLRATIAFTSNLWGVLLILAMTFDRFYGIIRPHKASSVNTVKKAKITCICIVLFGIIYNIPHIFFTLDVENSCVPYGKAIDFTYGKFYYWLSFVVNYSFPFVALLVMNSFIIHTIRNRRNLAASQRGQHQKSSETQIFIILLLVTFSFLLLTTPAYMLFLFNMIIDFNQSPRYQSGFQLFYSISEKTWYTNNGINFFLYIMSGTKFRKDFLQLFGRCCKKQENNGDKTISTSFNSNGTNILENNPNNCKVPNVPS